MNSCCICLEKEINKSSNIIRLSCGHIYHTNCIFNWFCIKDTCPLCCRKIKNKELEILKLKKFQDEFQHELDINKHIFIKLKKKELLIEKQKRILINLQKPNNCM